MSKEQLKIINSRALIDGLPELLLLKLLLPGQISLILKPTIRYYVLLNKHHQLKTSPMNQIKKEDLSQEVFDLYDDYAHSRIDRRAFVQKLSIYAVGGLTVSSLMSFLMPDYQNNIQVKQDDPRLDSAYITY